jgi:LmbE family N-acetylglucosaminyl deacetylase
VTVATIVFVHAHPDDETLITAGTMAKAAASGHRVVLVVATGGEWGEAPDDLAEGETVAARRRRELQESADGLGVARVVWLGYQDSGMTGWAQNTDPASFLQADVEEAAERLAAVLADERADVVCVYDWHGVYGHPDHIRVHVVGHRAAERAGTPMVYESTFSRERAAQIAPEEASVEELGDDGTPFGTPDAEITTFVDVGDRIEDKRASLACHRSQRTDTEMFLAMAPEVYRAAFGTEYFILARAPAGAPDLFGTLGG